MKILLTTYEKMLDPIISDFKCESIGEYDYWFYIRYFSIDINDMRIYNYTIDNYTIDNNVHEIQIKDLKVVYMGLKILYKNENATITL